MRSKKALNNIATSLFLQCVSVIIGFIVPRLVLAHFGSNVNGVLSSISQFLGYIVLMEAGVGGVTRAALYKPLAESNPFEISSILKATQAFFRKIALFFVGYMVIIAFVFPHITKNDFSWSFSFSLVLIIGISTFFQYYFGITYSVLLQADQRNYVSNLIQIVTIIVNAGLTVMLILLGVGIHIVKIGSALIFIVRPFLLFLYVRKNYILYKDSAPNYKAIKQRWDGLGHHLAYFFHTNTSVVIITLFTNLREVSVYSVYYMVASGVQQLVLTFSSGLEATFGNIIARNEKENLDEKFRVFELSSGFLTTIMFTTAALLIVPFISVYTRGINDVNYIRPVFAYLLIAAEAVYCIRMPYNSVTLAAGHYKQTRNGAFAEAGINVILSLILVNTLGIMGAAVALLCSMTFRTIQYAWYLSKNILNRSIWIFVVKMSIYILNAFIIILLVDLIFGNIQISSYAELIVYAVEVFSVSLVITLGFSMIFFKKDIKAISLIIKNIVKKRPLK